MPLPQERRTRLAPIGHWVAKSVIAKPGRGPTLTLIQPASSDTDEGYSPASSIDLYGKESILLLRDFLDAVLDDLREDSMPEVTL